MLCSPNRPQCLNRQHQASALRRRDGVCVRGAAAKLSAFCLSSAGASYMAYVYKVISKRHQSRRLAPPHSEQGGSINV